MINIQATIRWKGYSPDELSSGALWKLDNGITLCKQCHSKTDNYKGKNIGCD